MFVTILIVCIVIVLPFLIYVQIRTRSNSGYLNPLIVCSHCQSKGCVRVKSVTRKTGVSGSKATAAILTGGLSVLATGLSRKQNFTQAYCENCKSSWVF